MEGHLFIGVNTRGLFTDPDRLKVRVPDRKPAETAYVLARVEQGWRYCGVGRWVQADDTWVIRDLDFATWRALGEGRRASRRLAPLLGERAAACANEVAAAPGVWIEIAGTRCRVEGSSRRGGLRISGGSDGFRERTVSREDIGWVFAAYEHASQHGGRVDEAPVNRLRYLEGTPRGSTRWGDTGWAVALGAWWMNRSRNGSG